MTKYDEALALAESPNPDFENVRRLLEDAISKGDDRAQYALATWYLHGTHVERDLAKGIRLLKSAAAKGNAHAMFDLAVSHERGLGVVKHKTKAFALYKGAAEAGDLSARFEVGRMLYYGIGVPKDRVAADLWLAEAEKGELNESHRIAV